MDRILDIAASNVFTRWAVYFGFAFVFFNSGLQLTTLIVEPEAFTGGPAWIWVALFPFLLVGFFVVNRRFGCASGQCSVHHGRMRACMPPGH